MWRFHDECMTITPIGRNTPFVRVSVQPNPALGGRPLGDPVTALVELGQLVVEPCSSSLEVVRIAFLVALVGQEVDEVDDRIGQLLEVGADLRRRVVCKVGEPSCLCGRDVDVAAVECVSQLCEVRLLAEGATERGRTVGARRSSACKDDGRGGSGCSSGPAGDRSPST